MNTSGVSRDNCFLILGLPYDAPNLTDAEIVKAIDTKKKFWGRPSHVKNGVIYEDYLKNLQYIQQTMLNPETRKKEAEAARKYVDEELKKRMPLYSGLTKIVKAEVDNIENETGIPSDYLKVILPSRFNIQIVEEMEQEEQADPNPKPEKADTFKKSVDLLQQLAKNNLYELFVEEGSTSNPRNWKSEDLVKRVKELETKLQRLPNSSRNTCLKTLCKTAYKAFESDKAREEYDKFLIWAQTDKVIKSMKRTAEANGNCLSSQASDKYLEQLIEIHSGNVAEAKKVLDGISRFKGILIGTTIDVKKIKVCPNCLQIVGEKDQSCSHCGSALFVTCKKCGAKNSVSAKFCTQCNTSFAEIKRLIAECRLASDYIQKADLEQARLIIQEVESSWPGLDEVKKVKDELAKKDAVLKAPIMELRQLINNREYFQAKKKLDAIKSRYPNFEVSEERTIVAAIEEADRLFEKLKGAEKQSDNSMIIKYCEEIAELCKDYPGIREKMLRYPPECVKTVTCKTNSSNGSNIIEWSTSATGGNITYILVRKEQAISNSISDGIQLGEFSGTTFCEQKVKAGVPYYYTVFVKRAGVISKGTANTQAAINYSELKIRKVECGDGNIQISWEPLPSGTRVRAWRKEGAVPRAQEGTECRCGVMNLIDEGLTNDTSYGYRLCAEYSVNGRTVLTDGIGTTATPVALPQPIDKLEVTYLQADTFDARWETNDSKDKVVLFYTDGSIPYEYGESVNLQELSKTMKRAQIVSTYPGGCKFNISGDEFYNIVAVNVKYDTAVIGEKAFASKGKGIEVKEVKPVGNDMYVFMDWPKDARIVWALVSESGFALSLNDKGAQRISFRKRAYDINKALVFKNIQSKDYYVSLFAEIERGGDIGYTQATTVMFANKPKSNITYSIRVTGLFISKEVEITFSGDTNVFSLPDIEIYKSPGVVPLYKNKATLVRCISACEVTGEYTLKIPLKELQKGTGIKPFFKDENLYNSCTICPKEGTTGML